jgi:Fe-S cluster assembly iron-binding protein IscA
MNGGAHYVRSRIAVCAIEPLGQGNGSKVERKGKVTQSRPAVFRVRQNPKEVCFMLIVTDKAVAVLDAAKTRLGGPSQAGIRIVRGIPPDDSARQDVSLGFVFSEDPVSHDEEFEQNGLRIFVEDTLTKVLDGRTLDVREGGQGPELVLW